jgi:small subunit ribosomal protein S13
MLLSGYRLDENKRIFDSLQKIFGIGGNKAEQIICLLGLTKNVRLKDINYTQQLKLDKIMVHYVHGFRAKRNKLNQIIKLQENKSYRGVRHSYFLSVRGQRTKTNAKTQRNKKNKKKNKTGKNKTKK